MDTDLFQLLTLALLLINLVVLLLVLSALKGRGRGEVVEQSSIARGASDRFGSATVPLATETATAYKGGGFGTSASAPISGAVETTRAPDPVSTAAPAETAETAPLPGAMMAASAPAEDAAVVPVINADMPEEEPFERDGKWWFKRGDELLTYNEGTGEWVPGTAAPMAGTSSAPREVSPSSALSDLSATAEVSQPAQAESGMWKCSSCGAVNGSTADSCRMCFTSRP